MENSFVIVFLNKNNNIKQIQNYFNTNYNILKNKLDQQVTAHSTDERAKSIKASAYIRDSKEYSSDMEVNYA